MGRNADLFRMKWGTLSTEIGSYGPQLASQPAPPAHPPWVQ
jgi:hypothetical protein